jgi:hypothetical protein
MNNNAVDKNLQFYSLCFMLSASYRRKAYITSSDENSVPCFMACSFKSTGWQLQKHMKRFQTLGGWGWFPRKQPPSLQNKSLLARSGGEIDSTVHPP